MRSPVFFAPKLAVLSVALLSASVCPAETAVASRPSACPVELSAAQHPDGVLLSAGSQEPLSPTRQTFDLSIKNSRLQRIVGAELEVHGIAPGTRLLPAHASSPAIKPAADTVRSAHLVSSVPADQLRTRTVAVTGLTSVAWISVLELRYADGSVWHAGPGRVCAVVPNGMMLIANR